MIRVGSDCSGIGALDQALMRMGKPYKKVFACDFDYYARLSYIANYGTEKDLKLAKSKLHKKYADGVKKIALLDKKPSIKETQFLEEANEFAKRFSFYFPFNMYQREIPKKPLDVYVSTVPCQSFSIAGKRGGELDKRGILFYNSLEFIRDNNPRFFIFENVKGLLSHDKDPKAPKNPIGRTFQKWIQYLGGKSIDGNVVIMPDDNAVPYHIYIKVLNATDFGVPQNRERVFIVGIRDDVDNNFKWPLHNLLEKKLIDVLDKEVAPKYFLSKNLVEWIITHREKRDSQNKFPLEKQDVSGCVTSRYHKMGAEDIFIKVPSSNSNGYETATIGDSINFSFPDSKTRRGRVGKNIAQTLDVSCNQGVCIPVLTPDRQNKRQNGRRFKTNGEASFTITAQDRHGVLLIDNKGKLFKIRRLTPRECLRLMDFPEEYKIVVSDAQAYKQAGNSIVVAVFHNILNQIGL
nr:DNA (cytosine-5-)-methyltransferase [uncultured Allomuricauda sp.]